MDIPAGMPGASAGRVTGGGHLVPALAVGNLSKEFSGNRVLSNVSLTIAPGEVHAVLGQNGSGKSTFIKVLAGYHMPEPGGAVAVDQVPLKFGSPMAAHAIGLRFVHQDLGLVSSNSILDNYFMTGGYPRRFATVRRKAAEAEVSAVLERAGISARPSAKVASLTATERSQIAIARALRGSDAAPCMVLVLDEPTATLPSREVDSLLDIIRAAANQGTAILYITHHLDEVFRIANRVTVLRDGVQVITSPTEELSESSLVEYLVGGAVKPVQRSGQPHLSSSIAPSLVVESVSSGSLRSLSFDVSAGEILGIAGLTGSGRDLVLGAIFGAIRRISGNVTVMGSRVPSWRPDIAVRAGAGFLAADRKALGGIMTFSATENLTLSDLSAFWHGLRLSTREERTECNDWFERLDIRPKGAEGAALSTFSGGNQQKVLLAKWLRCAQPVLLLDDPTQGVDVGAKTEIHDLILRASADGAAIVVSSSDLDELATVCDRVLVMYRGEVAAELTGSDVAPGKIDAAMLTGARPMGAAL